MIYLDNSATTRPSQKAIDAFMSVAKVQYGNPSSVHCMGTEAAKILKDSREKIAASLHASAENILFTPSGTAADNLAILGSVHLKAGGTVVTTAIEHPAVRNTCLHLAQKGIHVVFVKPGKDGVVQEEDIEAALTPDTVLVSVMHVNNETGAIQKIENLKRHMNALCPNALLHSDCVQSYGKLPIYPENWGVDLVSVSAHKIHGLRGAGALYMRKGIHLQPLLFGGGQERDLFPGTENLPAIAAMAAASEEQHDFEKVERLSSILLSGLMEIDGVYVNSPKERLAHILNVSFDKVPAEVVTNALSAAGVCVSGGSACAGARKEKSHVLHSMGVPAPDSGIRFSLCDSNTEEEILETIRIVKSTIPMLYMALGVRR